MRKCLKRRYILIVVLLLSALALDLSHIWKIFTYVHYSRSARLRDHNRNSGSPLDTTRCIVRSMGCFNSLPVLFVPDMMSRKLTPNQCFQHCDDMSMLYAALHNGHTCYCGENLLGVALLEMSRGCTVHCNGDVTKNCGGTESSQVYMVTECSKDINPEKLDGCLLKTRKDLLQLAEENISKDKCISECESKQYTVAVSSIKCICGHRINVRIPVRGQLCVTGKPFNTLAPDMTCDNKTLLPTGTAKPIALSSFPGSGNTWFRQMIETATGVYTGSIYDEDLIFTHGFIGEKLSVHSGKTIVIKDHVMHSLGEIKYDAAILLIRDPYDAILAEYNRFKTLGHVGYVSEESLKSRDFHLFVNRKTTVWKNTYSKIISRTSKLLPVYFEDTVRDAVSQIQRILAFLPETSYVHKPNLAERLRCLEMDINGQFKRPRRSLHFDPFTPDLKRKVNENIQGLRHELMKANITSLPLYERQGFDKRYYKNNNELDRPKQESNPNFKIKL